MPQHFVRFDRSIETDGLDADAQTHKTIEWPFFPSRSTHLTDCHEYSSYAFLLFVSAISAAKRAVPPDAFRP